MSESAPSRPYTAVATRITDTAIQDAVAEVQSTQLPVATIAESRPYTAAAHAVSDQTLSAALHDLQVSEPAADTVSSHAVNTAADDAVQVAEPTEPEASQYAQSRPYTALADSVTAHTLTTALSDMQELNSATTPVDNQPQSDAAPQAETQDTPDASSALPHAVPAATPPYTIQARSSSVILSNSIGYGQSADIEHDTNDAVRAAHAQNALRRPSKMLDAFNNDIEMQIIDALLEQNSTDYDTVHSYHQTPRNADVVQHAAETAHSLPETAGVFTVNALDLLIEPTPVNNEVLVSQYTAASHNLYNHTVELPQVIQIEREVSVEHPVDVVNTDEHTAEPTASSNADILNTEDDTENTEQNLQPAAADTAKPVKKLSAAKQLEQAKLELKEATRINTQHLHTIRSLTQQRISLDQQLQYVHNIINGIIPKPVQYDNTKNVADNKALKEKSEQQQQYIERLQAQIAVLKRKTGNIDQLVFNR